MVISDWRTGGIEGILIIGRIRELVIQRGLDPTPLRSRGASSGEPAALEDVRINHGGLYVFMTEQFLHGADVVPTLKKMRCERMAEGVRCNGFVHLSKAGRLLNSPLEIRLVEVVTLSDATQGIGGEYRCREDILPGEFTVGVRVFSFQGIRKVNRAKPFHQVEFVLDFHLSEMETQRFEQDLREHGNPVIFALAIPDDDLTICKVQVLHAQAHDFHEAQTTAIHDLNPQFVRTVHPGDHFFRLISGQDGGDAFGFGRTDRDEGCFIQLDLEDMPVQKENGADGLTSTGSVQGF